MPIDSIGQTRCYLLIFNEYSKYFQNILVLHQCIMKNQTPGGGDVEGHCIFQDEVFLEE